MTHYSEKQPKTHYRGYTATIFFCIHLMAALPAFGVEIIAFGDSITAGTGSNSGGYPLQLQKMIQSTGKPCTIYNLGIPGERTHQGVKRIDSVLDSIHADMILIMEGTNDIRSGFPWQTTKLNLQLMIDKAKAKGVTPILATLTPSDQVNSEQLIPYKWNPMIKELAKQNGIPLVDQYSAIESSWQSLNGDGIHPNDRGYLFLAKTWNVSIEEMITSKGIFIHPNRFNLQFILLGLAATIFLYLPLRKKVKIKSTTTVLFNRKRQRR
ncbi:MAG: acyl-CoA thioesterase-1 [Desulforhopalus sp.]